MRVKIKIFSLIIFLSIFINYHVFAQGSWIKLSTPTSKNLKSIFFIDSLKGWVAGDSGIILFTSDGGNNWIFQQSTVATSIHDLFFLDSLNGWGITWHRNDFGPVGTTFLKTTDGGLNWASLQYPKEFTFLYSIFFNDLNNGWVCGFPGSILKTSNGGIDWNEVKFTNVQFSDFPIFKVRFFNQNFGIGCGGIMDIFGVIWRTTDGGEFWDAFPIGPEPINDFQIINEDFVFAVGGDYEYGTAVSYSTDFGLTWNYRTLDIFGIGNSVAFRNSREGWINLKGERKFLVSIDSGKTWTDYLTPDSVQPNKIIFTDSLNGYAVCDSGYLLKYIPTQTIKVQEPSDSDYKFINDFEFSIFPNPTNSHSIINFRINKNGRVKVELFNILGQKINNIIDDYYFNGEYQTILKPENQKSGVYFIKFSFEKYSIVKKVILIK